MTVLSLSSSRIDYQSRSTGIENEEWSHIVVNSMTAIDLHRWPIYSRHPGGKVWSHQMTEETHTSQTGLLVCCSSSPSHPSTYHLRQGLERQVQRNRAQRFDLVALQSSGILHEDHQDFRFRDLWFKISDLDFEIMRKNSWKMNRGRTLVSRSDDWVRCFQHALQLGSWQVLEFLDYFFGLSNHLRLLLSN